MQQLPKKQSQQLLNVQQLQNLFWIITVTEIIALRGVSNKTTANWALFIICFGFILSLIIIIKLSEK